MDVLAFLDDTRTGTITAAEHPAPLTAILSTLLQAEVELKLSKRSLGVQAVGRLGHVVDHTV